MKVVNLLLNRIKYLSLIIIFSLLSCSKAELETVYTKQEKSIDAFITKTLEANPDYLVKRNNGSNRIIIKDGQGRKVLKKGQKIKFYYAAYVFSGSISANNLFSTNHKETAEAAKWEVSNHNLIAETLVLNEDKFTEGLLNGLEGVKAGEICYIIFSGKYGFGAKPLASIPKNSALAYQIWVEEINNIEE